jgi:hypothetical protein
LLLFSRNFWTTATAVLVDDVAGFAPFLLLAAMLFLVVFAADFLVAGFLVGALDFAAFFALVIPFPSSRQSITLSNTCQ